MALAKRAGYGISMVAPSVLGSPYAKTPFHRGWQPATGGVSDTLVLTTFLPASTLIGVRMRIRVLRYPNAAARVFRLMNNIEGNIAIYCEISPTGLMTWYSQGNSATIDRIAMGSIQLALNVDILLLWTAQRNTITPVGPGPSWSSNAVFDLTATGGVTGNILYAPGSHTVGTGIHQSGGTSWSTVGPEKFSNDGVAIVFSDIAIGDTAQVDGYLLSAFPVAIGMHNTWTRSDCGLMPMVNDRSPIPSSSTSGARQSYTVPTLRQMGAGAGILTGALARVVIAPFNTWTPATISLWVNGVEQSMTPAVAMSFFTPGEYDLTLSGPIGLDDTLEIGLTKDASGSLRDFRAAICLEVEVPSLIPLPAATENVQTARWTYTGDGTGGRVLATTLPRPDVIIIVPIGATDTPSIWMREVPLAASWSESGIARGASIYNVTDTSFMVSLDSVLTNTNGMPYEVIEILDPTQRMTKRGMFIAQGSEDNVTVPFIDDPTWVPDFILGLPRLRGGSTANSSLMRMALPATDHAYKYGSNTGPAANGIQALIAGSFEAGGDFDASAYFAQYFALSATTFNTVQLFEVVSWSGAGGSQVITPVGIAGRTPALVLVLPETTGAASNTRSAYLRTHAYPGADAKRLSDNSISTTAITAFAAGSFTVDANCNTLGIDYSALVIYAGTDPGTVDLPPYWENPGVYGGLPANRALIMVPSTGTNFSRGKTVTMVSGTPLTNYPASNLTDDTTQTAMRLIETAFDLYIDLGQAQAIDGVAILNHNLDPGLVLQVYFADSTLWASGEQIAVSAVRPNLWIDLRNFPVNRRYVRIRTALTGGNSKPVAISEVVVASMEELKGVIEPESLEKSTQFWTAREFTEELIPYRMTSGVFTRRLDLSLEMDVITRDILHAVFEDAGMTGYRVLLIPDSTKNDAYWIDWPDRRETNFPQSDRVTRMRLSLTEETPGVLN